MALAVVMVMAGCSSTTQGTASPDSGTQAAGGIVEVEAELCERAYSAWTAPQGAGLFVVVTDQTASRGTGALAPGVADQLLAAQEQGLVMQVVRVEGPGRAPVVLDPVVLNPKPGSDSATAREERTVAASCALQVLRQVADEPATAEGSDILAALATGLEQEPVMMLVDSDGIPVGGDLGVDVVGYDVPAQVFVEHARTVHGTVLDTEVPVTWVNLARTATPLPGWVRDHFEGLYSELLAGQVSYDTTAGSTTTSAAGGGLDRDLPADVLPDLPTITLDLPEDVAAGQVGCVTVPAAVLFTPDSADLTDSSRAVVQEVATTLTGVLTDHPDWQVVVGGHTANYGTAKSRQVLSQDRATAVAGSLATAGIDPGVLTVRGYGATVPARDPGPGADAANRRVTLMVGHPQAIPPNPTC